MAHGPQSCSAKPGIELFVGESESPVGVFGSERFNLVAGKIDHQHPASRSKHVGRRGERPVGIVEVVQDLVNDGEVELARGNRGRKNVGLAQFGVVDPCAVEIGASDAKHRRACIETDEAIGKRGEQFDHPAGAGTHIDDRTEWGGGRAEHVDDGRLNQVVWGQQRTFSVPTACEFSKVLMGSFGSPFTNGHQTRAVGAEHRVMTAEAVDHRGDEIGISVVLIASVEREEGKGAFAMSPAHSSINEETQVARYPRLGLTENVA